MLAFASYPSMPPSSSPHAYLPAVSSPLSPRSVNIYGPRQMSTDPHTKQAFNASIASTTSRTQPSPAATKPTPFSQRTIKKTPSPRSDDLRAQRRTAFLRKVRDGRDERRFELREDDVSLSIPENSPYPSRDVLTRGYSR
jgi:hypothetical protein